MCQNSPSPLALGSSLCSPILGIGGTSPFYKFLFLFFLKNEGMSKSFCDEFVSEFDGIQFIFFSQVFDTNLSTPTFDVDSFFSNPVAITVI